MKYFVPELRQFLPVFVSKYGCFVPRLNSVRDNCWDKYFHCMLLLFSELCIYFIGLSQCPSVPISDIRIIIIVKITIAITIIYYGTAGQRDKVT